MFFNWRGDTGFLNKNTVGTACFLIGGETGFLNKNTVGTEFFSAYKSFYRSYFRFQLVDSAPNNPL